MRTIPFVTRDFVKTHPKGSTQEDYGNLNKTVIYGIIALGFLLTLGLVSLGLYEIYQK